MVDWKKIALFAGGTLFGTAGVKILASDDAKKVYTQCGAISQGDGKYEIDANSCIDCGTCAGVCPTGAIEQG